MNHPPENLCAIWGTPAETGRASSLTYQYVSPRAGGPYLVGMLARHHLPLDDGPFKARLTTWLVEQRRSGEEWPEITAAVLQSVATRPALRLSEREDRFFLFLSSIRFRPGSQLPFVSGDTNNLQPIAAWTESETIDEAVGLISVLRGAGLIEREPTNSITLTLKGFERLETVEQTSVQSSQAFVAMWFGDELDAAYRDGFAPGIVETGFTPFRIDRKEHTNKIDDEIVAEIRRSRFVVADFTCPILADGAGKAVPGARGGVYYEAGFAQGLQIPVIWTVRADCIDYVHFDTRQFAHIVWNEPEDLRSSLRNRINAVIIS
jgi:hypothetical protein